jgi:prepilin-type N-terminal cleavage/methylation domain-containing protein
MNKKTQTNKGMTYVELIVVLSIFSVLSSVVIFNYGDFQAKIDVKNLASDIALKVVEAQKSSLSGKFDPNASLGWKPSYGVYFEMAKPTQFVYFADLNNDGVYNEDPLDTITITKNDSITGLEAVGCGSITSLSIVFKRPDSSAAFSSNGSSLPCASYVQITIASPKGVTALIKLYPSGRVQVN